MQIAYPTTTDWSFMDRPKFDGLDADKKDLAEAFAWSTLAALCAFRIGIAPIAVRPCAAADSSEGVYGLTWLRGSLIGRWAPAQLGLRYAGCGCTSGGACACSVRSEVVLPGPIGRVESVVIDGVVVAPSSYRVDGSRLVRTDGLGWPVSQNMDVDPPAVGTFVVTYYRGVPPNPMVEWAAGRLAWEFYQAIDGKDGCQLPGNLVSLARAGEQYSFQPGEVVPAGLPVEVTAVVNLYNPYGLKSAPTVSSPDMIARGPRVTTWP